MRDQDDRELHDLMAKLENVPFRKELQSRVLERARLEAAERGSPKKRRNRTRFVSMLSGVAAACVAIVIGVVMYSDGSRPHTAAKEEVQTSSNFGLVNAPLKISNVRIGTLKGDPANSDVVADVKNVSNKPLNEADVFGVLSFTPSSQSSIENWLTFVNGPSQTVLPGQTVKWGFHPSGPHAKAGSQVISEVPHLKFYASRFVPTSQASAVWVRNVLQVTNIQVEPVPSSPTANWQSVDIEATIHNPSKQVVDLQNTRAIIWFAQNSTQTFLSDQSIRFLYHMTPETATDHWPTSVQPGQTIHVDFQVLSDKQSDFFSRTPHVIVIDAPNVTS